MPEASIFTTLYPAFKEHTTQITSASVFHLNLRVLCEQLVAKKWSLSSSLLVIKLLANSRKAVQKGNATMSTEDNKTIH